MVRPEDRDVISDYQRSLSVFSSNFDIHDYGYSDDTQDGFRNLEYHGDGDMIFDSTSSGDMGSPARRQHHQDGHWRSDIRGAMIGEELSVPLESLNAKRLEGYSNLEIDDDFICKISFEIMTQPVYDPAFPEHKYDLPVIQHWLKEHDTNPTTRSPLSIENLVHDHSLKERIDQFVDLSLEKSIFRPN
jgi:hypothetical protein